MSFTIDAPNSIAWIATFARKVSTEIMASGNNFVISLITGITLFNSSCSLIISAPGREEYPPISIILQPSLIIVSALCIAFSVELNFPPSKKESGVTRPINTIQ